MPSIGKISTQINQTIDAETRVAVTFNRLLVRNTLSTIADLYGIAENTTSIIIRECCKAIKIHLKPLVFEKLTTKWIKIISQRI